LNGLEPNVAVAAGPQRFPTLASVAAGMESRFPMQPMPNHPQG